MKRHINNVAVIGSGIMGSGIACHFANIGIEVLLLDIVPRELNEKEKTQGLSLDDKVVRKPFSERCPCKGIKIQTLAYLPQEVCQ